MAHKYVRIKLVKKMKKNKIWIFKSTKQMVVSLILFCIFMAGFVYFGTKDYSVNEITDSEKFVNEHKEVVGDNVFTYINNTDAYSYIKRHDVLILFGIRNSDWVGYYANILNEIAKEVGIEKIYYYDITDDRKDANATYESIVYYLKDYVMHLDDGKMNLYGPTLLIKKNGVITYFDDETATVKGSMTASEYWDNYHINLKKANLKVALEDYMEGLR